MWILSFLPDFVTHAIFFAGVVGTIAGFVLGFIPFIKLYQLPIQIISILLLSFGLYLEGGLADQAIWQLKVKELEVKIAKAQVDSQKVTTEVVTKVLTKKQVIKSHNAAAKNDITILKNDIVVPTDLHNQLATPPMILAPKK